MNYMEWALEKAKKLWREREQVMKERLSRAVAAGSGGKAAGEMNADKTAVREAVEKRQKRGLPDETEDAETAAQRLTRKLSGEDSGQRFKAEETGERAAPVGMAVRDTASPQMRIADNGERAAAWLWQELGEKREKRRGRRGGERRARFCTGTGAGGARDGVVFAESGARCTPL